MPRPTYEALQKRVRELEKLTGELIEKVSNTEEDEVFELSILFNISQALVSTRDLDEVLAIVIDAVNKSLLTEGAGVLLYDENRGDLVLARVARCKTNSVSSITGHSSAPQWKYCRLGLPE